MTGANTPQLTALPIDHNWTEDSWDRPATLADRLSPRGVNIARSGLRMLYPSLLTEALQSGHHPVVAEQLTYPGRGHLLELGLAVAVLRPSEGIVARLRHPDQYESAAAELRAALMFKRARASLSSPSGKRGQCRCEFIATFPDGYRLAVEVKAPNTKDEEHDVARVQHELLMPLMDRLRWLSDISSSARATFRFDSGIMELGSRHGVDRDKLSLWVNDAVVRVTGAASGKSPFGIVDLDRIGSLQFREEPGLGFLQFDAYGPPVDAKKLSRKLRRNLLNKGARQAGETQLPGVIVLDIQRDGLVKNTLPYLQTWANKQHMLAAILVIDRHVIANRMYGNVDVLFGPCIEEAMPALSTLFDVCEEGHLHYNPLSSLVVPCPCTWLPRSA